MKSLPRLSPIVLMFEALVSTACSRQMAQSAPIADDQNPWCHVALTATDGTNVQIDYQLHGPYDHAGYYQVTPLWINVRRSGLGSSDQAQAVIVNNYAGQNPVTSTGDLTLAEPGRLTGEIDGVTFWPSMFVSGASGLQEAYQGTGAALVIDGNWLSDPISGTHNFGINLNDSIKTCSSF